MAMATYNSMPALPSGASSHENMGLSMASGHGLGIEPFDQELQFDDSLLNSVNEGIPALPFTPTYDFETFSTTFEDPFSYSRPYETAPGAEADPGFHDEEASPAQLDDKLLGFSAPIIKASIVDDTGNFSELGMSAELYGMFFVAEDVFGGENAGRPLELTCYRRNLWQCSGQITLPKHVSHVVNEQGRQIQIFDLAASITAFESIEGKPTEIISIPWKSATLAANPDVQHQPQETKATAPPRAPLDLSGAQEIDGHRVSVPVSWKRLQFKSATANNGRRKGLQQHYVVQINLLGKAKTGEYIKIAEIQSGPVIVRGRSPRNFDSRKDVPLTGNPNGDKIIKTQPMEKTRTQSDSGSAAASTPTLKTERVDFSQNLHRYHSLGNAVHSGANEWGLNMPQTPTQASSGFGGPGNTHATKKLALSPSQSRPPVPSWGSNSSNVHKSSISSTAGTGHSKNSAVGSGPSVPINLSLSEDERSPNHRSVSEALQSPQLSKSGPGVAPAGSPVEEADLLYEYFPLSVDDWAPPVDTVYRPHIVHHIAVPSEIKAQSIRSKAKRYFSAE